MSNYDTEQIKKVKVIIKKYNNSSASLLQVELKVSYEDAVSLINIINTESNTSNNAKPVGNSNPISTNTPDLSILDALESHDFEYFCADILSYNGFTGIKVTAIMVLIYCVRKADPHMPFNVSVIPETLEITPFKKLCPGKFTINKIMLSL